MNAQQIKEEFEGFKKKPSSIIAKWWKDVNLEHLEASEKFYNAITNEDRMLIVASMKVALDNGRVK